MVGRDLKRSYLQRGISYLANKGLFNLLDDRTYLKLLYWARMGLRLNLDQPKLFNEKLQWLKLNDRKNQYTIMVDKQLSKEYVANIIGSEYIIPTLGIWDSFDEIDFEKLPDQFVLKCVHDSGGLVICTDKEKFDKIAARKKIEYSLKRNYYLQYREWPYKNIKPRIIAEKYMVDESGVELKDYKIQCFNGKADNILVCLGRHSEQGVQYRYFDTDWNFLRCCVWDDETPLNYTLPKPDNLEEMIEIAEKLSTGLKQLRVDLYNINGNIYFGEMTFFSQSGFDTDLTVETDELLGNKLVL